MLFERPVCAGGDHARLAHLSPFMGWALKMVDHTGDQLLVVVGHKEIAGFALVNQFWDATDSACQHGGSYLEIFIDSHRRVFGPHRCKKGEIGSSKEGAHLVKRHFAQDTYCRRIAGIFLEILRFTW